MQVVTGNIIEENHYYSYGLKIAAISSKKLGNVNEGMLKNNYLYQGAYSEMDDDIGWNDFRLRNYDPQIGRWVQQDPYQEFASPYLGMGCDPVNLIDPSGGNILSGLTSFERVLVTTMGGAILGAAADALSGGDGWTGAAIGAGVGLAGGLLNNISSTSMLVKTAGVATTIINTSVISGQAGTVIQGNQANFGHGPNNGNCSFTYDEGSDDGYNYYTSADIAAFVWAQKEGGPLGDKDARPNIEWSSLIFEKKDGKHTYYSYTKPARLKNNNLAQFSSPGPDADESYHGRLPKGATLVGFIHLHWEGSESLHSSNTGFSEPFGPRRGDYGKMADFPNLKFYILGSTGILKGRYPLNTKPDDPKEPYITDAGRVYDIAEGVYGPGTMTNKISITPKDLMPCRLH